MENQTPENQKTNAVNLPENIPTQKPRGNGNFLIILLLVIVFALAASTAYLLGQNSRNNNPEISDKPAVVTEKPVLETVEPTIQTTTKMQNQESYSEDTGVANQKKYVSPKLGISFIYLTKMPGSDEKFAVKEAGNKIYLYGSVMNNPESGQFLEVFTKNKNTSLADEIKTRFLSGKDLTKCFVETSSSSSKHPESYIIAEIAYPKGGEFDMEKMMEQTKYCSVEYARTNGIRYFLGDTNHPDKYLFLSIGQYAIMANAEKSWQDTIIFL